MSIAEKTFENADDAIGFLEAIAGKDNPYLFRGHSNREWRLCTTLNRYTRLPHEEWSSDIDNLLASFRSGLTKLVLAPMETDSRIDWLEYARHHGVPTPCIDFSYSPYVGLFFAFNGVRNQSSSRQYIFLIHGNSMLICLLVFALI